MTIFLFVFFFLVCSSLSPTFIILSFSMKKKKIFGGVEQRFQRKFAMKNNFSVWKNMEKAGKKCWNVWSQVQRNGIICLVKNSRECCYRKGNAKKKLMIQRFEFVVFGLLMIIIIKFIDRLMCWVMSTHFGLDLNEEKWAKKGAKQCHSDSFHSHIGPLNLWSQSNKIIAFAVCVDLV